MGSNYFTPENSWRHLFFITGLTADEFYTDGGLKLNIEQLTHLELKKSGYERIVFYDKDNKLYCYDDDSFALLRVNGSNRKDKNVEVGNNNTLIRQNRGLKRGRHAQVVSSNTGSHSSTNKNRSTLDVVHTSGEKDSNGSLKSGILIKSGGNGPLHLGMRDTTFVKRQIDAYMHDAMIKTAVVINDPNAFEQEFGREPMHSLTAGYERMGTDNENILVFLYTDGNLANFYRVNQFDNEDKDANVINVECPNTVELKNMLMYLRLHCGLKIHMRDLDSIAISLRQAMALSEHQIRIKEVYFRLIAFGTNKLLTPDLCYEIVGVKKPDSAKNQLSHMIGMQSVKDALENYDIGNKPSTANLKYLTASRLSPNLPLPEKKDEMIHFVLTGNPGTGKTTVAKLLGQMFYEMGYLESGHVVETDRSKLVAGFVGQTAIKTMDCIQKAMGGVLFIDEAYTLKRSDDDDNRDFGQEAIDTLLKAMDQYKGKFMVVAAGYPKEMDTFINSNPGLQRRFTEKIHIEDYTAEEMYEILLVHAKKNSVKFSDELLQKLPNFCENWVNSADENWGNAGEAVKLIEHMIRSWKKDSKAKSVVEEGQSIGILEEKHIPESLLDNLRPVEEMRAETLARLNAMTGLEEVKQTVEKLRRRMISGDMKVPGHYLFTGNPGTGKTTVARYMGQILRNLGLLKRGHLIEYTASDLMAEVFNKKNNGDFSQVAKRAIGGVLFIDEAYELEKDTTGRGEPILGALLPFMENNRHDISIIMAGYEDEMDDLLRTNPGFNGRFTETIHFENYNGSELCSILLQMLKDKGINADAEFKENALRALTRYVEIHGKDADFSNARYVRNVFLPEALDAQTNRLIEKYGEDFSHDLKKTLTGADIPANLVRFTKMPLPEPDNRSASEKLDDLIGYDKIKEELRKLLKSAEFNKNNDLGVSNMPERLHWVLEGNPGTGKTTIAKLIGQVYKECGILTNGRTHKVTRSDLVAEYEGQTAVKTRRWINRAQGGILFIDEAYSLTKSVGTGGGFGSEAIDELVEAMEDLNGEFAVICAGYPSDMEDFLRSNEGLSSRMKKFLLEDYKPSELVQIFLLKCKDQKVKIDDELKTKLEVFFDNKKRKTLSTWGNGREAENLLRDMLHNWVENPLYETNEDGIQIRVLNENHIPKEQRKFLKGKLHKEETPTSAMDEIDKLIGFEDVKTRLRDLIALKNTALEYDREDLLEDLNFHWVLRGNPGTGKTTVAKLIGKVYKELGLLSRGHTVEVTRAELVAEYMGQTAVKTKKCIERAMGGILFIDEAYSLTRDGSYGDPYGQEAIDTLLERMSALNGEFAVIAAGYPKEMDRFLNSNPGFQSRFGEDFLLKDYTSEELAKIFELKCNSKKFFLDDETRDLITKIFENMINAKLKNWANGRVAENLEKDMRKVWAKNPKLKQDSDSGEMISYYTKDHIPPQYEKYLPREADDGKEEHSEKVQVENTQATCTSIPMNKLVVAKKEFNYEEAYLKQVDSVVFIRTSTEDGMSSGSGSIITKDGYILTCNHVISGAENIQVRLQNRKNADVSTTWENADVVWEDTELDAAILKIRDGKYNALPLRTLETGTFTGEAIYLWGYPFGDRLSDDLDELQASLFQGYISSIQTKNGIERINTNMEAKRGCSGGPVFSKKDGSIIGILCGSQTVGDEGLIEEINYVLPVKYLFEKVFK